MNTQEEKQLSESLFAACKAAGIDELANIIQELCGSVWHVDKKPYLNTTHNHWASIGGDGFVRLSHPPYAADWQDSLLEWVEQQGEVLVRHPDYVADACKVAYQKMIGEYAGRRTESKIYKRAWSDALKWRDGSDQPSGIEAMEVLADLLRDFESFKRIAAENGCGGTFGNLAIHAAKAFIQAQAEKGVEKL